MDKKLQNDGVFVLSWKYWGFWDVLATIGQDPSVWERVDECSHTNKKGLALLRDL
jgi:hypothetical protein